MITQEPVGVSPGGMPCRVREWLLKDFEEFFGPPPWSCDINDRFHTELGLLIRFSESLQEKKDDKQ